MFYKNTPLDFTSFINENCHNSSYDDVMLANCDVIVFFPIYSQFAAIRNPDSGRMVFKNCIFINYNLLSYKN